MGSIAVTLLVAHFIGDFLLQSDWMAINKSKRWDALALHVSLYSLCFLPWGWPFAVGVWVTHFVTDAITSRITSALWFVDLVFAGKKWREVAPGVSSEDSAYYVTFKSTRHWFFVVIGADQLIHYGTLAWLLTLTR